jgi:hypothetical protein
MKTLSAAIAALCLLLTPAKSTTVTDTFTGVVVGSDNLGNVTTTDFNNNFGGGNLIGQTFTVTMSVDTSIVSPGTNFVTGGTFYSYFAPNPISSTITINGYTLSLNDSSDGYKFDQGNGTVDAYLQAFVYNSGQQLQTYGIALELFTNVQATPDLTVMLPSMLLANGDYTNYFATFYDTRGTPRGRFR